MPQTLARSLGRDVLDDRSNVVQQFLFPDNTLER